MKVITFGTLKGGVGKTMLCFNVAGVLSQLGHKVLIIDSDLQGNLTNNIGIDRTTPGLLTLYDIYGSDSQPKPDDLVYKSPNRHLPNLDIIPGSMFLHRAEIILSKMSSRELILRNYIKENSSFFSQYSHILVDTNPSMSLVNQNAFAASDSILLISDISMNSLEGSQLFIALWEETRSRLRLPDNIRGFIVNDFDTRTKLSSDLAEYLITADEVSDLRDLLMHTIIPRTVRITEAELSAMPINLYDAKSKGSEAIASLVKELSEKNIL